MATPGSASTGLLFSIILVVFGLVPAIFGLIIWMFVNSTNSYLTRRLPGFLGMLAISMEIRKLNGPLPDVIYAMLSGFNSAVVGLIGVAAIQLATRSIKNQMTRFIVAASSVVAMLYKGILLLLTH